MRGWNLAAAAGLVLLATGCITINEAPETSTETATPAVTTTRTVTVQHTTTTTQTAYLDGQASGAQGFGFYYEWYEGDPYVVVVRVPEGGVPWSRIVIEGCEDGPDAGFVYPGDVIWDCGRQDRVRIWLEPEHRLLFDHESPLAGSDLGDSEEDAPDMAFSKNNDSCSITVVKAPSGANAVTWELDGAGDDAVEVIATGGAAITGVVDGADVRAGDIIRVDSDSGASGDQCAGVRVTIIDAPTGTLLYETEFS